MIVEFLRGATAMADIGIALFFYRFWRDSADGLFAGFSAAFALMAVSVIAVAILGEPGEFTPFAYIIRVVAFLCIILAIVSKNIPEKN